MAECRSGAPKRLVSLVAPAREYLPVLATGLAIEVPVFRALALWLAALIPAAVVTVLKDRWLRRDLARGAAVVRVGGSGEGRRKSPGGNQNLGSVSDGGGAMYDGGGGLSDDGGVPNQAD